MRARARFSADTSFAYTGLKPRKRKDKKSVVLTCSSASHADDEVYAVVHLDLTGLGTVKYWRRKRNVIGNYKRTRRFQSFETNEQDDNRHKAQFEFRNPNRDPGASPRMAYRPPPMPPPLPPTSPPPPPPPKRRDRSTAPKPAPFCPCLPVRR